MVVFICCTAQTSSSDIQVHLVTSLSFVPALLPPFPRSSASHCSRRCNCDQGRTPRMARKTSYRKKNMDELGIFCSTRGIAPVALATHTKSYTTHTWHTPNVCATRHSPQTTPAECGMLVGGEVRRHALNARATEGATRQEKNRRTGEERGWDVRGVRREPRRCVNPPTIVYKVILT